jgi:hypothetical protein
MASDRGWLKQILEVVEESKGKITIYRKVDSFICAI